MCVWGGGVKPEDEQLSRIPSILLTGLGNDVMPSHTFSSKSNRVRVTHFNMGRVGSWVGIKVGRCMREEEDDDGDWFIGS